MPGHYRTGGDNVITDRHTIMVMAVTDWDRKESAREVKAGRRENIYRIGIYFKAIEDIEADVVSGVPFVKAFCDGFTPTRQAHALARKLGLAIDVQRGQWVRTDSQEGVNV